MKKNMNIVNLESVIAELAKSHKAMKEQIASVRIAVDTMEAESQKMQSALEAAMIELMKAKESESKKKASKLWSITYTLRGVTKQLWSARDIYNALGGKTVKGFCEMVDGLRRGDCVQLRRDIIKVSGCPEYSGDSLSYWMDEVAVDEATAWMAKQTTQHRKPHNRSYNEMAVIKRYEEVHNATQVAKEFDLNNSTVGCILKRNGVNTPGKGSNRKVTPEIEAKIIYLYTEEGLSQLEISKIVDVSTWTVSMVLRRNGIGRGLDR